MPKEKVNGGSGSQRRASAKEGSSAVPAVPTTSQVVTVDAYGRGILIGPNGRTLQKLLMTHGVRMSLSRSGLVTVSGREKRVAGAVAHIGKLLRQAAAPSTGHYGAATSNPPAYHARQQAGARRVLHALKTHPSMHPFKTFVNDVCRPSEALQSLGKHMEAVLQSVLDYVRPLRPRRLRQGDYHHRF
ncbi:hypothetical protein GWK47_012922 [Chionoecetes opilio]|uniref:K Homology domain-containing protein n=1 Tax=Chionoecetes opilio TaxID=41210 RepID=A0A8J4Y1K3_CHIOP|nr:hypothetical protein GWK47_012922 [Chionoecetes opilio]